ncbi:MAG TPA: HEAT repeat domain-containing protein [Armatimonadota bacterium]|nr:HEAT repeat domain-containing protein [Armatimonadota bacterium]
MSGASDTFGDLVQKLSDADAEVRASATTRLMLLDDAGAVEPLLRALEDCSSRVRAKAALALGHYQPQEAVTPLLDHLANDQSARVRAMSAAALSLIGGDAALDGLIPAMKDSDPRVRNVACSAFAQNKDRRAVDRIMELLEDSEWHVRLAACDTLVTLGVADERVLSTIEHLRLDPEAAEHKEGMVAVSDLIRSMLATPKAAVIVAEIAGFPPLDAHRRADLREVLEHVRERLGDGDFGTPLSSLVEDLAERARKLAEGSNG